MIALVFIFVFGLLSLLAGIFNWKKVLYGLLSYKTEGFLLIFGWTAYRVLSIIVGAVLVSGVIYSVFIFNR